MGAFAVAQIAGFGIGPLIGGAVRDAFGSNTAFATMALLLAGTGIFVLLTLPSRPRPRGAPEDYAAPREPMLAWSELLRRRFIQAAMVVTLVVSLGWASSRAFLAVYVVSDEGLGTGSATFVGILLGGRALTSALLQPFFGRLADRANRIALVMIGLGFSAAGQFMIPSLPANVIEGSWFGGAVVIVPWLLALYLLVGVAEAVAFPAQSAIFVTVGRTVGMGSIMGVNQMAGSVGFLGGSLVGAAVVSNFGIENVFRYAGVMSALGAVLFLVLMLRAAEEIREAERVSAELSGAAG
jgi:MFS family permease